MAIYLTLLKTRKNGVSLPLRSMAVTSTRIVLPSGATRRTPLLMALMTVFRDDVDCVLVEHGFGVREGRLGAVDLELGERTTN